MPTVIKGQPTSEQVLDRLKAEDRPVALCFSCGKDSREGPDGLRAGRQDGG